MRLLPHLAKRHGDVFQSDTQKAIAPGPLLSGSLRKARGPVSPTAPLLHLRELSSGRENSRLLSHGIELFEIGDDIINLLRIFQARKGHLGTGYLGLRILDVFAESCFIPGNSG